MGSSDEPVGVRMDTALYWSADTFDAGHIVSPWAKVLFW